MNQHKRFNNYHKIKRSPNYYRKRRITYATNNVLKKHPLWTNKQALDFLKRQDQGYQKYHQQQLKAHQHVEDVKHKYGINSDSIAKKLIVKSQYDRINKIRHTTTHQQTLDYNCIPKSTRGLSQGLKQLQSDAKFTMANVNTLHDNGWINDKSVAKCRNMINYNLATHYVKEANNIKIPDQATYHNQIEDTCRAMDVKHVPTQNDYNLANSISVMTQNGLLGMRSGNQPASLNQDNTLKHQSFKWESFKGWHPKVTNLYQKGMSKLSVISHKIANYPYSTKFKQIFKSRKQNKFNTMSRVKRNNDESIKHKMSRLVGGGLNKLGKSLSTIGNKLNQSPTHQLGRQFNVKQSTHIKPNLNRHHGLTPHQQTGMER